MAQIVGVFRIGKDAELRQTDRSSVANLALATNYGQKDRDGKRETQWVDASLWGKRAEALADYLVKGQQVYVVIGDPHIETYEGRNGTGTKLVGTILEIELVGGKPSDSGTRERPQAQRREREEPRRQAAAPKTGTGGFDDMDDDIPF